MLEVIESDFTKNLKEPSLEEDEAENGYQKDTQENNVTKASNANRALYVLEFEHTVIFATFVKYVQKTTSPIRLDFKAVAMLSKIVWLVSETCFESSLNSATKCLGFCETRRHVSFETDSRVTVEYFCLLNLVFGYETVLMMNILDDNPRDLCLSLNVSQDVSQDVWQNQAAHQSNKNYEYDDYTFEFENDYIFVFANEVSEKTTIELDNALEENYITVYVKTINGKTISIKCDKQQIAATISDEVERRSSIPRGMTYLRDERKENNRRKQHWNRNYD